MRWTRSNASGVFEMEDTMALLGQRDRSVADIG